MWVYTVLMCLVYLGGWGATAIIWTLARQKFLLELMADIKAKSVSTRRNIVATGDKQFKIAGTRCNKSIKWESL